MMPALGRIHPLPGTSCSQQRTIPRPESGRRQKRPSDRDRSTVLRSSSKSVFDRPAELCDVITHGSSTGRTEPHFF